jgi:hydroxymethylglutaryl-CoA synthase
LALLSALDEAYLKNEDLTDQKIGFLAYGSGSKSKCFEGFILPSWKEVMAKQNLFDTLENRKAISFAEYEQLHTKKLNTPLSKNPNKFILEKIEQTQINLTGARYYSYK